MSGVWSQLGIKTWCQVWPLTLFFVPLLFVEKSLICFEDKIMTPLRGTTILFHATPSSRTLKGFVEMTQSPSRDLNLDSCLPSRTSEAQGYCQVCWALCKSQKTVKNKWRKPCVFVKYTFWHWSFIFGKNSKNLTYNIDGCELATRPAWCLLHSQREERCPWKGKKTTIIVF